MIFFCPSHDLGAAIEPVIGHMEQDNRLERNYLKGIDGDKMNAFMAACGFNLRTLQRAFIWLLVKEIERVKSLLMLLKRADWVARGLKRSPGLNMEFPSGIA